MHNTNSFYLKRPHHIVTETSDVCSNQNMIIFKEMFKLFGFSFENDHNLIEPCQMCVLNKQIWYWVNLGIFTHSTKGFKSTNIAKLFKISYMLETKIVFFVNFNDQINYKITSVYSLPYTSWHIVSSC